MKENMDYVSLNKKIIEANKFIGEKKFKEAKEILLSYIKETKDLYEKEDAINYSFRNITEFYLFVNTFKVNKGVYWINLKCDEAYRLLGYVSVEEKEYDKALEYLNESFKYNPVNIETFFEMVEVHKMSGNLNKMKKSIESLYEYIYEESSLARFYRNLGFYYIEKENYDLAFSLYLISLEYQYNNFALNEMVYIRQKLNDPNFIIDKKDAVKIIKEHNVNIGISKHTLSLLKNLSGDKSLKKKNPNYVKSIKNSLDILTKTIK